LEDLDSGIWNNLTAVPHISVEENLDSIPPWNVERFGMSLNSRFGEIGILAISISSSIGLFLSMALRIAAIYVCVIPPCRAASRIGVDVASEQREASFATWALAEAARM